MLISWRRLQRREAIFNLPLLTHRFCSRFTKPLYHEVTSKEGNAENWWRHMFKSRRTKHRELNAPEHLHQLTFPTDFISIKNFHFNGEHAFETCHCCPACGFGCHSVRFALRGVHSIRRLNVGHHYLLYSAFLSRQHAPFILEYAERQPTQLHI